MEIPLALTILAGVLLYGVVFCVMGMRRGNLVEFEEEVLLESKPQVIQKKHTNVVDGGMARSAKAPVDRRFGGDKVVALPITNEPIETERVARLKA